MGKWFNSVVDMFLKLFQAFKKVKLNPPQKNDVIIFDVCGSDFLSRFVLDGIGHTVLPVRHEEHYFTLKLAILFIKNFFSKFICRADCRNIFLIYLLSCVEYIQPKIVITFIDNNYLFHTISNVYNDADFYAIQNGLRMRHARNHSDVSSRCGSTFKIKNLLCFGEHERELYQRYGHSIAKIHPVGSLKGSYFKTQLARKDEIQTFDLCIISQWRKQVMLEGCHSNFKKAIDIMNTFILKFIVETKISFCVATCLNEKEEREYYKNIFGEKSFLVDFNRAGMSTYFAIDKSKVAVTFCSTVGYEAFGWGKKVLFCNFSDDNLYDFPIEGLWSVFKDDYKEFKNKLTCLLETPERDYRQTAEKAASYVMNYNFSYPVHSYLRDIILKRLR